MSADGLVQKVEPKRYVIVEPDGTRHHLRDEAQVRAFMSTYGRAQPVAVSVVGLAPERWAADGEAVG